MSLLYEKDDDHDNRRPGSDEGRKDVAVPGEAQICLVWVSRARQSGVRRSGHKTGQNKKNIMAMRERLGLALGWVAVLEVLYMRATTKVKYPVISLGPIEGMDVYSTPSTVSVHWTTYLVDWNMSWLRHTFTWRPGVSISRD